MPTLLEQSRDWVESLNQKELHTHFNKTFGVNPQPIDAPTLCRLYVKVTGNTKVRQMVIEEQN